MAILVLINPLTCWSDEYVLVMSKDNVFCRSMLKLYNDDLSNYGKLMYDEHNEFTVIKWNKMEYFVPERTGRPDRGGPMLVSEFDINNDNTVEIVVKTQTSVTSGGEGDSIYVFGKDRSWIFREKYFDARYISNSIGSFGTRSTYELKELAPGRLKKTSPEDFRDPYYYVLRTFRLYPFRFNDVTYISMENKEVMKIDIKKWVVILKYLSGNKTEDICYMLKIRDCSTDK